MLEAYSSDQALVTNEIIPFNSVTLQKGTTATLSGVSTINLNKCGVYEINFNIEGLPSATGDFTVVMTKDGVAQPQTERTIASASNALGVETSITTLVQVPTTKTCCPCSSSTNIQFMITGVGLTAATANVVVTKLV